MGSFTPFSVSRFLAFLHSGELFWCDVRHIENFGGVSNKALIYKFLSCDTYLSLVFYLTSLNNSSCWLSLFKSHNLLRVILKILHYLQSSFLYFSLREFDTTFRCLTNHTIVWWSHHLPLLLIQENIFKCQLPEGQTYETFFPTFLHI